MDYVFTLRGVSGVIGSKPGDAKAAPKFVAKAVKKKATRKIQSHQTHEGYTINIAISSNVDFENETPSVSKGNFCWWDTCEFDEEKVTIPYHLKIEGKGKDVRYRFFGPGCFCDIFCLWAYLRRELLVQYHARDPRIEEAIHLTKYAFSLMFGDDVILKEAPDWRLLDKFGGPLTITDFRKSSHEKVYLKLEKTGFHESETLFILK